MKSILITGINGLLGKSLSQRLASLGMKVTGIVRKQSESSVTTQLRFIEMDLSSAWSEDKLPSSCDVIIHLAQSPHFRDFPNSALDVFKINIESPARLLDYAK